jgi:hypothetical protein
MGTGLFDYIAQACQSLAATAAPSITAMGTHILFKIPSMTHSLFGGGGGGGGGLGLLAMAIHAAV